jgi:hypothetical protein
MPDIGDWPKPRCPPARVRPLPADTFGKTNFLAKPRRRKGKSKSKAQHKFLFLILNFLCVLAAWRENWFSFAIARLPAHREQTLHYGSRNPGLGVTLNDGFAKQHFAEPGYFDPAAE